jgi:RES domain-containing protein
MVEAWRLIKARHVDHAMDGEGARLYGGRWNSPGIPIVYLAESLALAALEVLVHMQDAQPLRAYVALPVRFDAHLMKSLRASDLPKGWRDSPAPASLRALGDAWARERKSAVLAVPSAIVESERIFLANPAHSSFSKLHAGKPRAFVFDARLRP